jgi:hypothetical protein
MNRVARRALLESLIDERVDDACRDLVQAER